MANMKKKISNYFEPGYDSDEDLDASTRAEINNTGSPSVAEGIRRKAWENADAFSKIKKTLKGAYYGDKRKKNE